MEEDTMGTPLSPQKDYDTVFLKLLEINSSTEDICSFYKDYIVKTNCLEGAPEVENVIIPHWRLIPVIGKIKEDRFFNMLANGCFPINAQLRAESVLKYCTLRDFFHDFVGHVPFLASQEYSDTLRMFGIAYNHTKDVLVRKILTRLYWATIEFGLIEENGLKVLGAGLVSSYEELKLALNNSDNTQRHFDLSDISAWEFNPYGVQDRHYILKDFSQIKESIFKIL